MFTGKPIQNNFCDFDIDDNKSRVHEEMQYGRYPVAEHFLLSKGQQQYIPPTFPFMVINSFTFTQKNISSDLSYLSGE
jgi:hypothetical protein